MGTQANTRTDRCFYGRTRGPSNMLAHNDVLEPTTEVLQEIAEHPGKWFAITPTEVVSMGNSPAEAMAKARAKGVRDVILYKSTESNSMFLF